MAHRVEFTKDITLPSNVQQYRFKLQKQIRQLRQRQQVLSQEHKQKILMLQKRLLYGKKKIFSFDRKMNHMTLTDQLAHYNLQVQALKKAIARQQQHIRDRQKQLQSPLPQIKMQFFPSRTILPAMMDFQQEIQKNSSSPILKGKSLSIGDPMKMSVSDKSIKYNGDPQQQLMKLTHQIMRLKKSLQQVRSKYSDNFTEYKLRQQYQKLKQQNALMTQQLRQLQTIYSINQYKQSANQAVDYGQMQTITAKRQYQLVMKDKRLLQQHLAKVYQQKQERQSSDKMRTIKFNQNKIMMLKKEIDQMTKNNLIIHNQLMFVQNQIKQRYGYQRLSRANLPLQMNQQ